MRKKYYTGKNHFRLGCFLNEILVFFGIYSILPLIIFSESEKYKPISWHNVEMIKTTVAIFVRLVTSKSSSGRPISNFYLKLCLPSGFWQVFYIFFQNWKCKRTMNISKQTHRYNFKFCSFLRKFTYFLVNFKLFTFFPGAPLSVL